VSFEVNMNDGFEMCDSVSGKRIDGDVVHFGSESEEENDNIIRDEFHTLDEVQEAIRKQGLETCNLIFGKYAILRSLIFQYSMKLMHTQKQQFFTKTELSCC
jgi:hypothetical protein